MLLFCTFTYYIIDSKLTHQEDFSAMKFAVFLHQFKWYLAEQFEHENISAFEIVRSYFDSTPPWPWSSKREVHCLSWSTTHQSNQTPKRVNDTSTASNIFTHQVWHVYLAQKTDSCQYIWATLDQSSPSKSWYTPCNANLIKFHTFDVEQPHLEQVEEGHTEVIILSDKKRKRAIEEDVRH